MTTTPPPTLVRTGCRNTDIPPAAALSWEAYAGRACYACGKALTTGAVLVGRAKGRQGAHVLDTDVYACP
ncbi:hypothetical protein HW130_34490 [Streptomyces sp. PKU-EA00015]|uniref:hypothetical protein n=1 Tax=Streptomyces sp. PKU-EA00015 TaxID=2748326 RepID=UPI0015A12A0C|nr:hypothetical protein [Streptomyces sp. PKU-EA00015]NWF31277.1 hypothetical protein [Streptomyces sp. PKU-EA00015]